MNYQLLPPDQTEAIITGEGFAAISLPRKRQLAQQLSNAEHELRLVVPPLLGRATEPERKFIRALLEPEPPAPVPVPETLPAGAMKA